MDFRVQWLDVLPRWWSCSGLGHPQISATSFIWLKMGKLDSFLSCFTDHLKGSVKDRNGMDLTEAEGIKRRWQQYTEELYKKDLHDPTNHDNQLPRARHPGMWSQVGLRKYCYKQSYWRSWNSSWAISNPGRWCCESAALNMPANLKISAVAAGLVKFSFHSNPKERQCQRMLKLPHNCTHLTR